MNVNKYAFLLHFCSVRFFICIFVLQVIKARHPCDGDLDLDPEDAGVECGVPGPSISSDVVLLPAGSSLEAVHWPHGVVVATTAGGAVCKKRNYLPGLEVNI